MHRQFARALRRYVPEVNEQKINQAYTYAKAMYEHAKGCLSPSHRDRLQPACFSFRQDVRVAEAILPFFPNEDVLVAALLHELPCLQPDSMPEIEQKFGREVSEILEGIGRFYSIDATSARIDLEDARKLFLMLAKDIRVVLLRFVDRLESLRAVSLDQAHLHKDKAAEVLNVYSPVAARLGIYRLKVQLEDAAFRLLEPAQYQEIREQILDKLKRREGSFNLFQKQLRDSISTSLEMDIHMTGRIKSVYSVYTKLKNKNTTSIEDIHDLFAARIILPDEEKEDNEDVGHCYRALSFIHSIYTPMKHRFKDYIAMPKWNGYRSLHTTILPGQKSGLMQPVEIQIRTRGMHREAEFGIASHWWYDSSQPTSYAFSRVHIQQFLEQYKKWYRVNQLSNTNQAIREAVKTLQEGGVDLDQRVANHNYEQLARHGITKSEYEGYAFLEYQEEQEGEHMLKNEVEWLQRLSDLQHNLEHTTHHSTFRVDIFKDRIFVINSYGQIKELPVGSTPVDFAYALDVDLGHRCHMAKVNGKLVSLDRTLENGDLIEIIPHQIPTPNRYWLSFVVTQLARKKIKEWFGSFEQEKKIQSGKEILNKKLLQLRQPELDAEYSFLSNYEGKKSLSLTEREYVLELLGTGALSVDAVLEKLKLIPEVLVQSRNHRRVEGPSRIDLSRIRVEGEQGLPVRVAGCCSPSTADSIVGYVTRGEGVTIHLFSCSVLRHNAIDGKRLVRVTWDIASSTPLRYKITVKAHDRVGFLRDICAVMADLGINIEDTTIAWKNDREVMRDFILNLTHVDLLKDMHARLKSFGDIIIVEESLISAQ